MGTILNPDGSTVDGGPADRRIQRLLDPSIKIFEGLLKVTVYEDAIEGVGKCFWCSSSVGGLVRFDAEERKAGRLTDVEIRKHLYDMIQARHQCGARLHDGKTLDTDFLKRFE